MNGNYGVAKGALTAKKAASHPDVPRPSNDELVQLALEVCHAIERCGASPELTNAVMLASDMHTYLRKPLVTDGRGDFDLLRSALAGLVGVDTEDELRQMEATMRVLPAPDADKAVTINAIHALLATKGGAA